VRLGHTLGDPVICSRLVLPCRLCGVAWWQWYRGPKDGIRPLHHFDEVLPLECGWLGILARQQAFADGD